MKEKMPHVSERTSLFWLTTGIMHYGFWIHLINEVKCIKRYGIVVKHEFWLYDT